MAMAAELACCRNSASCASWDVTGGTKLKVPAAAGGQKVSFGSRRTVCSPVRAAGEEVGTEEKLQQSAAPYKAGSQQKKWTGYVEKDTAGQTNIYSVEPEVYVSESPFSSGEKGAIATEGNNSTTKIAGGLSVLALFGAVTVAFTVGQSAPVTTERAVGYDGPPLSYYIAKFTTQATAAATQSAAEAPELASVEVSD